VEPLGDGRRDGQAAARQRVYDGINRFEALQRVGKKSSSLFAAFKHGGVPARHSD
jgi:hypothetical protein